MNEEINNSILKLRKTSDNIFFCISVTTILILIFIISPLKTIFISFLLGRVMILILVVFMIYYNLKKTNEFMNENNIKITGKEFFDNLFKMIFNYYNSNLVINNIIASYIFTIFLITLFLSIISTFF